MKAPRQLCFQPRVPGCYRLLVASPSDICVGCDGTAFAVIFGNETMVDSTSSPMISNGNAVAYASYTIAGVVTTFSAPPSCSHVHASPRRMVDRQSHSHDCRNDTV